MILSDSAIFIYVLLNFRNKTDRWFDRIKTRIIKKWQNESIRKYLESTLISQK